MQFSGLVCETGVIRLYFHGKNEANCICFFKNKIKWKANGDFSQITVTSDVSHPYP